MLHMTHQPIMSPSPKAALLAALRADDAAAFRALLGQQPGWPSYSRWSDYELLLKAVRLGCKRVAWLLLERGARVFKRPRVNGPLLEAAARPGWTNIVKVLLDKGARVGEANRRGDTALHVAFARQRSTELLDLLLRAHLRDGAGDEVNEDGLSLLHIACTRPNSKAVKALLKSGQVDVGVQVPVTSSSVYAGFTPLHFAVAFGQHEVVELLLDHHNADVYVQNAIGSTPLHVALHRRDVAMIDLVLSYENRREDCCDRFGLSHFMAACAGSDENLVEEYLSAATYRSWAEPDGLVNSQVQHCQDLPTAGYTPLHFAAEFGRFDSAKILLRLGARCCATTASNATPFALACRRNHAGVCNLLMDFCEGAGLEPPAKRRRIDDENAEGRFADWCDALRKRRDSSGSEKSTLTSSFVSSSALSHSVESLVSDPRMLCVNPRQIFEQDGAGFAWQKPKVFDFHDDVDMRESCSAPRGDHSIRNHGVWNFINDEAKYCSIDVPKDVESDFHEPLDDVVFDDTFETVCVRTPAEDYSSFRRVEIFADDDEHIEDDQMKFDELFEKYLQEISASEARDMESSFMNNANSSLVRETDISERKLKIIASSVIGDSDDTLEVTSSSIDSGVLEEITTYSDDDSITMAVSSGYGSDASMREKTVRIDSQSTWSSPERKVEVIFVEVGKFNDRQAIHAKPPIDSSVDRVEAEKQDHLILASSNTLRRLRSPTFVCFPV